MFRKRMRFGRGRSWRGQRIKSARAEADAELVRVAALQLAVRSSLSGEPVARGRRVASGVRAAEAALRRQYARAAADHERQAQAAALSSALAVVEDADREEGVASPAVSPPLREIEACRRWRTRGARDRREPVALETGVNPWLSRPA